MKSKVKKMPRLVYEIRFEDGVWSLFAPDGEALSWRGRKGDVVTMAALYLESAWEDLRIRSELVIKTRGGEIQDKRTYGEDPKRSKG
ncbi:MAG: hypothetical protein AMXMBFR56_68100 [Polyangiaceae bacterium]